MSIATKTGDQGFTALTGGLRVSKSNLCVKSYGTVDELNTVLGFARSLCTDPEIAGWTEQIQRTLFRVGASLSTPIAARKPTPFVTPQDVDFLTELVYKIEATDGILSDWSLPGANTQSAAYEMARTICRRAERIVVEFQESGHPGGQISGQPTTHPGDSSSEPAQPVVEANVLAFLNRLSDLIWLFGRLIEVRAGIDARLRDNTKSGPDFSRAW